MANGSVSIDGKRVIASGQFASGDLIGVWVPVHGDFMLTLGAGFTGTIKLEFSPDSGTTAYQMCFADGSTPMSFTAGGFSTVLTNSDPGGMVRLNATGISGTLPAWRIAGNG